MTYDVQHFAVDHNDLKPTASGSVLGLERVLVVLADEAEANERAAVEEAYQLGDAARYRHVQLAREQMFRDCIAAVNGLRHDGYCCTLGCTCDDRKCDESCSCSHRDAVAALRALCPRCHGTGLVEGAPLNVQRCPVCSEGGE